MAVDSTYTVILKEAGDKTFTMPSGFEANVEIHCWGAGGGGSLVVSGGGGGYARTTATINTGDVVRLQIGQPGANGGRGNNPPSPGGTHPSYTRYRGGSAGSSIDEDADMGSGGGGGGASAVLVNDTAVCVGAGGGGAGGPGDDSGSGTPGNPGGVYPNGLTATTDGGNSVNAWASGGGGGGGYLGGAAGTSYGDDAGNAPGGSGGQNYGDITDPGSGSLPGGRTVSYYPSTPPNIGRAGSPGYIVMIFQRKPGLQIKNPDGSGNWVSVNNSYTKVPTYTFTVWESIPPTTVNLTSSSGTWVVPKGVTSVNLTMIGGGGSGQGNYSTPQGWPSPGGGSAAYFSNVSVSVTPGTSIAYSVGGPGANTTFGALIAGAGGNAPDRSAPNACQGGAAGIAVGAGGVNGTQGGAGICGGGNGYGANSPFGIGGVGYSSGPGGRASGYGAGGGGGGNNVGGGSGSPGKLTLSYSSPPVAVLVTTGGWKEIQQMYVKNGNVWKPISQKNDIVLYNYK